MHYSIAALLFAIALTALQGCGQTGPLYLPDSEVPPPPAPPVEQVENVEPTEPPSGAS